MLARLFIENIAIIERLNVVFSDGFNALSGETGAGKSILIDALGSVLGSRVNRELIRTGEKKASCTAVFEDLSELAVQKLASLGFSAESGSLTVSREIFSDGRNVCRVGESPAAVSDLKAIAPYLAFIHGQHDGRDLLDEDNHIDHLDRFIGLSRELSEFEEHYEQLLALNRRIRAAAMSEDEKEKRQSFLQYQIAELKELSLNEGEYQSLTAKKQELMHWEKLFSSLKAAAEALNGSDDEPGACELLMRAGQELASCAKVSTSFDSMLQNARELEASSKGLSSDIVSLMRQMTYEPDELSAIEDKLEKAERAAKKNRVTPDELPGLLTELERELGELENYENDIEELKDQYSQMRSRVSALSRALHEKREKGALALSEQTERQLADLGMNGARFIVEIENYLERPQARFTKKGTDGVRFLLSANKGEEARPLSKVASGGELSRIMLALKVVLPREDGGVTAVFDEIDAGVSGRAANSIAEKLFELSRGSQVICITHLPQIAAMADEHFLIEKNSRGGRTFSSISPLDESGRIAELSRLTSGLSVTEAARTNARDMLVQASLYKKNKELR